MTSQTGRCKICGETLARKQVLQHLLGRHSQQVVEVLDQAKRIDQFKPLEQLFNGAIVAVRLIALVTHPVEMLIPETISEVPDGNPVPPDTKPHTDPNPDRDQGT